MTPWNRWPDGMEPVEPFTVRLAVGSPEPAVGRLIDPDVIGDDIDATDADIDDRTEADHLQWDEALHAALQAVFARGGVVAARFDPELFPILWATALLYSEAAPAEHGEDFEGAPLEIDATTTTWFAATENGGFDVDSIDSYEATGAVRVTRVRPDGATDGWMPGPGRHFGLALWPDGPAFENADMMQSVDRAAVLPALTRPVPGGLPFDFTTLPAISGAPPLLAIVEQLLDEWLGIEPPNDSTDRDS